MPWGRDVFNIFKTKMGPAINRLALQEGSLYFSLIWRNTEFLSLLHPNSQCRKTKFEICCATLFNIHSWNRYAPNKTTCVIRIHQPKHLQFKQSIPIPRFKLSFIKFFRQPLHMRSLWLLHHHTLSALTYQPWIRQFLRIYSMAYLDPRIIDSLPKLCLFHFRGIAASVDLRDA